MIGPAYSRRPARSRHLLRRLAVVTTAVVAVAGAAVGVGFAVSPGGSNVSPGGSTNARSTSDYGYYQQLMGRYVAMGPGMMGNNYSWMLGQSGFAWMMGGSRPPGWMAGGTLPRFVMGSSTDVGQVIGKLFAAAPGPRVTRSEAASLGNDVPVGATVNRAADRITFTTSHPTFDVLAGAGDGRGDSFRIAGLENPTLVVPAGANVDVQVINAANTAHGLVVTSASAASSFVPMMHAAPAFLGAAVWFLADPSTAGLHLASLTFSASRAGSYRYLCPVPGQATDGMVGTFIVSN